MNREVFDRSATCVALTPTRESYVGPELPPDAGIHARKQQAETLGGLAIGLNVGSIEPEEAKWRDLAICKDTTELFFPSASEGVVVAKKICDTCPVQVECLEFALETREDFGIWGGTSERERQRILRQRQRAASTRK